MNSAYETSYDAGMKPFIHDRDRGRWASPMDFFFACVGHAFKYDVMFAVKSSLIFGGTGFVALIDYFVIVILCTLPIVLIQSFLGQFSSTGFISVFRIAPLFKGLGYVSLVVNLLMLTFYSIFAAIPLFYFFHSLRPVLPWSCEGSTRWLNHTGLALPCNLTNGKVKVDQHTTLQLPSDMFFRDHMDIYTGYGYGVSQPFRFSWPLMGCNICVWAVVWFVLTKRTEMIGRIIRFSTMAVIGIMALCVVRLAFLPGENKVPLTNTDERDPRLIEYLVLPLLSLGGLGPGWGSILSMASYNKFQTDITMYSWLVCLGQAGLMVLTTLVWLFVRSYWTSMGSEYLHFSYGGRYWMEIVTVPSALSMMEMPHFWSLLFCGMMAAAATNLVIVQLLSVLTSLFDEFEVFRRSRRELITLAAVALCLCSMIFCSNMGIQSIDFVSNYTILTQVLLNLMLLLVVLWVYGRERFQRDLFFMTGRRFYTWMTFVVRFVTPGLLLYTFFLGAVITFFFSWRTLALCWLVSVVLICSWLIVPVYGCFKVYQITGDIVTRLKRCVRPTDWHPADPEDWQRYEEAFGSENLAHQLRTDDDQE